MKFAVHAVYICIIVIAVWFVFRDNPPLPPRVEEIDVNNHNLKSGDILLFRHDDMAVTTRRIFGDEYSHTGIVYQDSRTGILYLLESDKAIYDAEFLGYRRDGPRITPLWTRLNIYQGRKFVKRLSKPMDPGRAALYDRLVDDYTTRGFGSNKWQYLTNCILMLNTDYKGAAFCSMFIAQVIRDLDLVELTTKDICMRPQCFANIYQHTHPRDGYAYAPDVVELKIK